MKPEFHYVSKRTLDKDLLKMTTGIWSTSLYDYKLLKNKKNTNDKWGIFLRDKRCSVYKSRPVQCRTWPFWPENMNSKIWNNEISKNCPGIGKGKIIKKREILKQINADYKNALSIKGDN